MAKDTLGNHLKVDDLLLVKSGEQVIVRIVKISDGGLIMGSAPRSGERPVMMAGMITAVAEFQIPVDPQTGIATQTFKLIKPDITKES